MSDELLQKTSAETESPGNFTQRIKETLLKKDLEGTVKLIEELDKAIVPVMPEDTRAGYSAQWKVELEKFFAKIQENDAASVVLILTGLGYSKFVINWSKGEEILMGLTHDLKDPAPLELWRKLK